jgi:hypothetical protein
VVRTFLLSCPATYALVETGHISYHGGYLNFSSWFEKNKFFEKKKGGKKYDYEKTALCRK